jgi:amino acid transporter
MFERFRSRRDDDDDRGRTRDREGAAAGRAEGAREVRARQRDEYGGVNWGAAFFGWLVALGMAAILMGIVSAAGAATGLTEVSESEVLSSAEEIGLVGAALLLLVLAIAYYCGGYVSGRMSRFDGGRQGLAVWIIGLLITILLAVLGAIADSEYNVLAKLDLPRIPVDEGSLTAGGVIALIAVVVITIIAAVAGGKAGERYHRKVDRVGFAAT